MKFAIRWAVVLLSGIFVSVAVAQNDGASDLSEKWKIIEGHQKNLDESYKNRVNALDQKFDIRSGDIDAKVKKIEEQQQNLKDAFKNAADGVDTRVKRTEMYFDLIIQFFGPISLVGVIALIASIFRIYKSIPKLAEEQAKERFDRHFSEEFERRFHAKEGDIKRLIRLQDEEALLRKNKKVLVLSKAGTDTGFLKRFFEKMGFENVAFETFEPSRQYRNNDLILINNRDKCFDDPEIISYHEKVPEKTVYFCLGQGIVRYPGNPDNVAFTNAIFQLYGNLINALRHQDMLGGS